MKLPRYRLRTLFIATGLVALLLFVGSHLGVKVDWLPVGNPITSGPPEYGVRIWWNNSTLCWVWRWQDWRGKDHFEFGIGEPEPTPTPPLPGDQYGEPLA